MHNPEFPVTKVYLLDPEFSITRDKYNQVLRKSIGALVVYKGNPGGCMMQWDRFGYEHLGGGAFNDEMGIWSADMNGDYSIKASSLFIYAGNNIELDCSIVK